MCHRSKSKSLMETLRHEHDEIWAFTEQLEQRCIALMEDNQFDVEVFRADIDYIRSYADHTHHKKEEDLLFRVMVEELGEIAVKLVQHGMLVEHDLARLFVMELETAVEQYEKTPTVKGKLEILSQAMGYVHLIRRHIEKENEVVYPFAERSLSAQAMRKLEKDFRALWVTRIH